MSDPLMPLGFLALGLRSQDLLDSGSTQQWLEAGNSCCTLENGLFSYVHNALKPKETCETELPSFR